MTRRGAVKASLGTALAAVLGPTLGDVFSGEGAAPARDRKSVILLWLEGGPYQQDTFDPKDPAADSKLGFKYAPVDSRAYGLEIASSMPLLGACGQHLTFIRSMVALETEHKQAEYYMQTGWRSTGPIQAPAFGSIVSHELGAPEADGLPAYVSIGRAGYPAGHFGPAHMPTVVWDPKSPPENLGLPNGVSPAILDRRLKLLEAVEGNGASNPFRERYAVGREGAVKFMRSSGRAAFDLQLERESVRQSYGTDKFGQGCLLARRLVESGVRFVQVRQAGYDTHEKHYEKHDKLVHVLDRAMSRLIVDLKERGLLDSTVVIAAGEFGRTPNVNGNAGRDHWINGFSVALAGGGFKGGHAYGRTNKTGQEIEENPVRVPDFMATVCKAVGIDGEKEFVDDFSRPIKLVDDGNVLEEILV
jgi:hypothetical protein